MRAKKGFLDDYRHFDPEDGIGYGSERQWRGAYASAMGHEEAQERVSASGKEPCAMLDLPETAAWPEIKRAYLNKAAALHPDRRAPGLTEAEATEQFKALQAAYTLLQHRFRK